MAEPRFAVYTIIGKIHINILVSTGAIPGQFVRRTFFSIVFFSLPSTRRWCIFGRLYYRWSSSVYKSKNIIESFQVQSYLFIFFFSWTMCELRLEAIKLQISFYFQSFSARDGSVTFVLFTSPVDLNYFNGVALKKSWMYLSSIPVFFLFIFATQKLPAYHPA